MEYTELVNGCRSRLYDSIISDRSLVGVRHEFVQFVGAYQGMDARRLELDVLIEKRTRPILEGKKSHTSSYFLLQTYPTFLAGTFLSSSLDRID